MGPGGIATIIASCSLAIIAIAIGYAIVRVGRLVDQAGDAIKKITDETTPLLEEVTTTVSLVNGPLKSINKITKSAEELTEKISTASVTFLDKNNLAMKAAGVILAAAQLKKGTFKPGKSKRGMSGEQE
jgi:methyl-accepting chemotaxis protein